MSRFLIVMLMALTLAACGGSGSNDRGNTPPNGAPTVTSANFQLDRDTDLSATLTATDPENNAVTFSKTSDPTSGQIVSFAASGAFTYRPNAGFTGIDSFGISASDGTHTVAATITFNVNARPIGQILSFIQAAVQLERHLAQSSPMNPSRELNAVSPLERSITMTAVSPRTPERTMETRARRRQ